MATRHPDYRPLTADERYALRKKEQSAARLRKLQDKIIAEAERIGPSAGDVRLSHDAPSILTLANIRHYVFPEYETELESVLHTLTHR